jgi:hypothetical protein
MRFIEKDAFIKEQRAKKTKKKSVPIFHISKNLKYQLLKKDFS